MPKTATLSDEARQHVRRAPGRPRATPAPTAGTSAIAPAPAAPMPWADFGNSVKAVMDPLYAAVGAELVPLAGWEAFTTAWGAVVEYYLPKLTATPWPGALVATGLVGLPLAVALPAYFERRRAARAKPAEKPPARERDEAM